MLSLLACGTALAAQGRAPSNYELQETRIYRSLLRYAMTQPLQPGNPDLLPAICVERRAQATALAEHRGHLLRNTDDRSLYPLVIRYDRLARSRIRGAGRRPDHARDLDPGGLRARVVALERCDELRLLTLNRPLIYGNAAFVAVAMGAACDSSYFNFVLVRRESDWQVEGFRWSLPAGEFCTPTPRSRRPSIDPNYPVLLMEDPAS